MNIPGTALSIINKLRGAGYAAVFAGGCVRDMLLGIQPVDYDVATSALPDEIEALFERTIPVGKAFGVILVIMDGDVYEVAAFRTDVEYKNGRRPSQVRFGSLEEDAQRRDLTINGMFYDPVENKLYDYVGGQNDIERQQINFIGDPKIRIEEDKLRILRVIRFALKTGFTITPATLAVVAQNASQIAYVSSERIADELLKILRTREFRRAIALLYTTGLLSYILPEATKMKGVLQPPKFHPEGDVLNHTIITLEHLPDNASDELIIGALLHDVGKPDTFSITDRIRFNGHEKLGAEISKNILRRLRFSNDFISRVTSLVESHMRFMSVKNMKLSTLKRFVGLPHFEEHLALHLADCQASHGKLDNYHYLVNIRDTLEEEEIKPKPLINGHDLIGLGLIPGPIFKTILSDVETQQLEGLLPTKEAAIYYVKDKWGYYL